MIRGLVPSQQLLEWKVEDGWEPLCKFLGKEVPHGQAFPRTNDAAGYQGRIEDVLQKHKMLVLKNMFLSFACLVAIVAFAWKLRIVSL